ncbi:MAG TPA: hypothetical protein VF503_00185 [Sphingobium sp.]|uniref:hypothetical protein n=1 Tax=Sphingobium sp. TaxID=1912891 RepID=UPI002ED10C65
MTLRDHFAGQALSAVTQDVLQFFAINARKKPSEMAAIMAEAAYQVADAMLAERAKVAAPDVQPMRRVAYFDEGEFHWMSGIAPRDCELYAKGGAA